MDFLLRVWHWAKYFIFSNWFNPHYNYYCYYSHFTDWKTKLREVKLFALGYLPSWQLLELKFEPRLSNSGAYTFKWCLTKFSIDYCEGKTASCLDFNNLDIFHNREIERL